MKRNIKLVISYDGTDFCGWQIQKNGRSVQGEIENALKQLHSADLRLTGSGRTDSGVHANGQVANFYTDSSIPTGKFVPALNSILPQDVRILESSQAAEDFHSRFDAKIRIYRYYIKAADVCLPSQSRYCWRVRTKSDILRLNKIAAPLVGVHDFTAFAAAGDPSESKTRLLYSAVFTMERGFIVFKIAGNAFLWRMVRSIVGTIIEISNNGGSAADMLSILDSKDRSRAGATAPPQGLFLDRVLYDEQAII
ncbi:MAG: tRNA pseudouridine(38-40) synthase TruA [Spirochaetales bacterium]|uniref:tRNA pseudouridine synthase A n=1 Tax=Candidatus Thalassospirochaeta sargassi TaxID=3119039 RepID=A0AAJ1IDP1_9SPIO|nr:tRNA pseudouridine(38-40) synthase TruA [Spirochaetales bacterium]